MRIFRDQTWQLPKISHPPTSPPLARQLHAVAIACCDCYKHRFIALQRTPCVSSTHKLTERLVCAVLVCSHGVCTSQHVLQSRVPCFRCPIRTFHNASFRTTINVACLNAAPIQIPPYLWMLAVAVHACLPGPLARRWPHRRPAPAIKNISCQEHSIALDFALDFGCAAQYGPCDTCLSLTARGRQPQTNQPQQSRAPPYIPRYIPENMVTFPRHSQFLNRRPYLLHGR